MKKKLQLALVWFFGGASLFAGLGFLYKLYEFFISLDDKSILGFAIAPLANYALAAGGFLCLLVWAFLSGQFSNIEQAKFDLLADQERFDREDAHLQNLSGSDGHE